MTKIAALFTALAITPLVLALLAIIMLFVGAFVGWIGELVFPQVFGNMSEMLFGKPVPGWQIGAMLGFIGSFFRGVVRRESRGAE